MKSFGQMSQLNKLKIIVEKASIKPVSVQRDSLLTVTMLKICKSVPLNDLVLQQAWTDSLDKFSKISKWEQTEAYSHYANSTNYYYKGFVELDFKEIELATGLFKKFQNEPMYDNAFTKLVGIITNFLIVKPLANEATEKKYLNYFLDGLALAKRQGNIENIANLHLCLVQYYIRHRNYEVAKKYAVNAWEVSKIDPDEYFYYFQSGKSAEGFCLLYLGKPKEGFELINQTRETCKKMRAEGDGSETYILASTGVYLGNYYLEKKDYQNALREAKMGEDALKIIKLAGYEYVKNKILYQAYKNLGKPEEALKYFEKVHAFDQEAQTKESLSQYTEWQLQYEDEKQKNKIQSLENQRLTQTRNILLLMGLFALGVIGYVFWNNRKLKNKNEEIQFALLQGQTIERKRMASELHDNISNKILGVKMRVEMLENENFTQKERNNYQATLGFIDEVYADVRLVSHNLLPEELEKKGLGIAIENLVKKINLIGKTHFEVSMEIAQSRFSLRLEYEVYNVILELVNNILKHSEAKNAMISIFQGNNLLKISVKDNGKGFDNKLVSFDSLGLKSIHSRIAALKGKVDILNNNGTEVFIEVGVS
jgi:signal transduction histidine kinase